MDSQIEVDVLEGDYRFHSFWDDKRYDGYEIHVRYSEDVKPGTFLIVSDHYNSQHTIVASVYHDSNWTGFDEVVRKEKEAGLIFLLGVSNRVRSELGLKYSAYENLQVILSAS